MKSRTRIATSVLMILFSVVSLSIVLTAVEYATVDELTSGHKDVLDRFRIGTLYAFIVTEPMWSEYPSSPGTEKLWIYLSDYFVVVNATLLFICWYGRRRLKKPVSRQLLSVLIIAMAISVYFTLYSIQYYFSYEAELIYFFLWLSCESFCLQIALLNYALLWCIGLSLLDIREAIKLRRSDAMAQVSRPPATAKFSASANR